MADRFVYSPIDFAFDCYEAGFRVGKGLVTIIAIAGAETAGTYDPKITNTAGNTPPSTDRGILEINSYWHPEVSDDCAFDPGCSAKEGFRISKQGTTFTAWAAYNNGAYQRYLAVAWMAVDAMNRIMSRDKLLATANTRIDVLSGQVAEFRDTVETLELSIKQRDSELAGLTSQLATLTADEDALSSQLQAAKDALEAANADLAAARARVNTLTTAIDEFLDDQRRRLLGT